MNAKIHEYHFRNNEIEKQLARIDSIYHNRSASFTDLTHTPKGKFYKAKTKQFIAEMLKLIKDADSRMPTKLYSEIFEQFTLRHPLHRPQRGLRGLPCFPCHYRYHLTHPGTERYIPAHPEKKLFLQGSR